MSGASLYVFPYSEPRYPYASATARRWQDPAGPGPRWTRRSPRGDSRGVTFGDAFTVATPLLAPDGSLIAAISAAIDPAAADRLDDLGEELKKAVAALAPRYGLTGPVG